MSLGLAEILFVLLIFVVGVVVPVLILLAMADSKGRSKHFAWWAVGFGLIGFIIAAIIIAAGRDRKTAA